MYVSKPLQLQTKEVALPYSDEISKLTSFWFTFHSGYIGAQESCPFRVKHDLEFFEEVIL
jgi:hypothetical protein